MNNLEIIANEACVAGLFAPEEVIEIIEEKGCLPLHTFKKWRELGMQVKKGEHARIITRLWKQRKKKDNDESKDDKGFYLTKAFLFAEDQVEPIEEGDEEDGE